ncbi:hypothetical protein [Streptomyces canus]|uniref:hypothetical protein n=1 Tax=Streptomyces canus TaxID=58343 RepID=UPI0036E23D70
MNSTSLRIPSALRGSSPTALPDPLSGLITGGLLNRAYWPAADSVSSVQPAPVSALWLMAAGRDCLRSSHTHRLMVDAARLRTVSETGPDVQAAWESEEDHEVRDPAPRPQIPIVSAPPTAR